MKLWFEPDLDFRIDAMESGGGGAKNPEPRAS